MRILEDHVHRKSLTRLSVRSNSDPGPEIPDLDNESQAFQVPPLHYPESPQSFDRSLLQLPDTDLKFLSDSE
jgi:hypothetical protein